MELERGDRGPQVPEPDSRLISTRRFSGYSLKDILHEALRGGPRLDVTRETPYERCDPADERPTKQQVEDEDGRPFTVAAVTGDDARQQVHDNGEAEEEDDDRKIGGHGEPPGSTLQRYPVSASAISRSIAGRRAS